MNNFIPVEVKIKGKLNVWYMDISNLGLTDLIELRKELNGNKIDSVYAIDAIIHENIGYNIDELKSSKREIRKTNRTYKKQKVLIKKIRRNGK